MIKGMVELNEPQVWTLIGVFATALGGVLTFMSTMFMRTLDARFLAVQAQFETVHVKLDHLDRDVQAIASRVFPERSGD